ncbi:hypothetical protein [Yinghuangia seranimata]|uniref:hypothetical protein n=1 Tax=Yinghuangia seranimata TaxID=408067 RepID=UPI00248AD74F|nr:hypothetical protein [Yinghuangia seranimata]MDI2130591.1 hypothetical protein [Yinghuangia seranimata]
MAADTCTRITTPASLRDRAVAALRARDEAAARAEHADRGGDLPPDAVRATYASRMALAGILGVGEAGILASLAPHGTVVLTVVDPSQGGTLAFLAERTHPAPGHRDAPAFRFHVMAPCPGCRRSIPVHEVRELADLGLYFSPRNLDENAVIADYVSAPGALDPVWHTAECALLRACHD